MGIALFDAMQLARRNRDRSESLRKAYELLQCANQRETTRQERARNLFFDRALVPFRDTFSRMKNLDLADLADLEGPPEAEALDVELQRVRVSAVSAVSTLIGGAATGTGAGALTFTAVGTFAAASTGTAISSLSGAAATSATLAWLGGGSLAAGGGGVVAGTAVLASVVALPILAVAAGFTEFQGRKLKRQQREVAIELTEAETELQIGEAVSMSIRERSRQVRLVLWRLRVALIPRIEALAALVDDKDDYLSFTPAERASLAATLSLVTAAVTVMQAPLFDEHGVVTDLSAQTLSDAAARLTALDEVA